MPQLPDTADELNAIARNLGVAASDIHLGEDASATTLKRMPLADSGIVYFATHGLVAGDVKGVAEPSLVLSIPRQPTELDDGLLTSSEVAQLKLNADWVMLSACNTACDIDLRPPQGRTEDRPRRGVASGHAGLSQRRLVAREGAAH